MASPRSLIRRVAAEAPVAGSRRSRAFASELGDASVEPEQPAVPRKGTPRSLIRELASGRAEAPLAVAELAQSPEKRPAQDPRDVLRDTIAATPISKKRVSMVQMTLASPEAARGAPSTPLKRKESLASNASMATPDASTPASKRSRNSLSPPSSGGKNSPSPQLSQRHSLSVMAYSSSPPPLPLLSAPAQRAASIAVPRLTIDAPLPFELPDTVVRKKSTPRSKVPQVGGAADRKRVASVSLPSNLVRGLASSYTKLKIDKEAITAIEAGSDKFLKQLCGDLSAYAKHRKTKTVEKSDFECLLKRQRHSYTSASLDDLLRRHISAELVEEVLTVAKAGNVLVPNTKQN